MREIKFRAWEPELKIMLEPIDLSAPLQTYKWLGRHDYPIMQFTGLKDKNGKDVYEGDVVQISFDSEYPNMHREILEIKYEEIFNCYDCTEDAGIGFNFGRLHGKDFEVIGNIYENPELLS